MYLQIFVLFAALQLSFANEPVIFQKDNIVIATEDVKPYLPQHHQFIPVHFPYYKIITNQRVIPKHLPIPQKPDSLPADIIEIASKKLGIKNIDEIPSVSELGELLGTTSRKETIDTIRQLTATESGIDLIKAFIESTDYTDNTKDDPEPKEADTSGPSLPTSLLSETAQKDLDIIRKVLTTPKPELGFFQRVSSYLNVFDLFPTNKEIPYSPANEEVQQIKPNDRNNHESYNQYHPKQQPVKIIHYYADPLSVRSVPDTSKLPPPPPNLRWAAINREED